MGLVLKWVYGATSLRSRYGTDNAYGATRSLGNESSYGPNIKALADWYAHELYAFLQCVYYCE